MMNRNETEKAFEILQGKLRKLYTEGKEIGLSLEESIIYGIEYSDQWPFDDFDSFEQEKDYNG